MRLPAAIALLVLLPLACVQARAGEPEEVFAEYHRAAMKGDMDGMLEYSLARQRAEMKAVSPENRESAMQMVKAMMPGAYTVERKTLGADKRATLIVSGPWDGGATRNQQVYGTVKLLMEDGEWKVYGVSWTTEKPASLNASKRAPAPVAAGGPAKAGTHGTPGTPATPATRAAIMGTGGAPVVGSMASGSIGHKLGNAKPECVYKPVMTAKDIENCR